MAPTDVDFDTIVIGLGAHGSAALYHLSRTGQKVMGIEQHGAAHSFGSSHGNTRITRLALAEGPSYAALVRRSHELWRTIEQQSGTKLFTQSGCLIISTTITNGGDPHDFLNRTITAANAFKINHEILTVTELRARYPQFKVRDIDCAYFEPEGGFLNPESCVGAQLGLAQRNGATIHLHETVIRFAQQGDAVTVKTSRGEYRARTVIVTAGAWLPGLLARRYARHFSVMRQVQFWFAAERPDEFSPDRCPTFIWERPEENIGLHGFAAVGAPKGAIKVASWNYMNPSSLKGLNRTVSVAETKLMYETRVRPFLAGVRNHCVRSSVCVQTVLPGSTFAIDRLPDQKNVIIASACSGHGFKHSAAIGESLAQMASTGNSSIDLSPFARCLTLLNHPLEKAPYMSFLARLGQDIRNSFYSPEVYKVVKEQLFGRAAYYAALSAGFGSLLVVGTIVVGAMPMVSFNLSQQIAEAYPDALEIQITQGVVSTNVEEPYEIIIPELTEKPPIPGGSSNREPAHFVVIDTRENLSMEQVKAHDAYIVLGHHHLYVQDNPELRVIDLTEANVDLTVTEASVVAWAEKSKPYVYGFGSMMLIIVAVSIFAFLTAAYLLLAVAGAVVVMLVGVASGNTHRFGQAFVVATFALIPVAIIDVVTDIIGFGNSFWLGVAIFVAVTYANIRKVPSVQK